MSRVESFYDDNAQHEWERFTRHRTEFAVTKRTLAEYLPPPPARVLDCGGGPGRYSIHLAQMGYEVTLLDLSANNLRLAVQKAQEANTALKALVHGNALDLSAFSDSAFDVVLLMGPLYHLVNPADRHNAAAEAARVLHPGGLLFAAFITFYAPFRDAVSKGYTKDILADEQFHSLMTAHTAQAGGFTDAWFAHPGEVLPLMEGAGLQTQALIGVESIAAGHEQHLNALDDAEFETWMDLLYRFSRDPSLYGAADHLLYIGTCPGYSSPSSESA